MKKKLQVITKQNNKITLSNVKDGCGGCSAKSVCGTGVLSQFFQKIITQDDKGEQVGYLVELEIDNKKLFINSAILYLLPILAMLTGSLVGEFYYPNNTSNQLIMSLLAFMIVIVALFLLNKQSKLSS